MAGGLMGGRNSLGGSIMNMLSSANISSLMPLLQLLGGGGKPQPTDLLQLLSALPKPAPAPAPAADAEAAPAAEGGSAMLSQLLADPQLLASLAGMLAQMGGSAAAADAAEAEEMTEDGYIYDEPEDGFCEQCRAACPRALQLFPSYEQVRQMSRSFPRY